MRKSKIIIRSHYHIHAEKLCEPLEKSRGNRLNYHKPIMDAGNTQLVTGCIIFGKLFANLYKEFICVQKDI